jgi:signal transduction histidine kinase
MRDEAWHVVLDPDGTVLAATDGAPAQWVGAHLENCRDAPRELKEAALAALRAVHRPGRPVLVTALPLPSAVRTVHLMTIEALPVRRVPTDLRSLLTETLDALRQQAEAIDVAMHIVIDPGVPERMALDAGKIAWAVATLVGNALRYVRSGSRRMPGGTITVQVTYDAPAAEATITVQDDGTGIPRDKLPSLVAPARDRARPVGLGLAMVRDVIAAHGGRVDVQSSTDAFGHGTIIRLTFPSS